MSQRVWLVTGCSSGFREQFVHSIIARGDEVIATARNLEKIKHLEEAGAVTLQLDVTDSQQSISETISKAIDLLGRIDVLVNNAAYVAIGNWEDLEYEDFRAQFDTNVFGTTGWIGHPGVSAYAGSKFALEGLVEALWRETSDFGIKTLLVEPGRFRTKLLSGGNMKAVASNIPDYAASSTGLLEGLAKEDQTQPGDPAKLVNIILDLVRQEGIAEGKQVPFRLPLGIDCYDDIKAKCEETLQLLREWENVIRSTDHND